MHTASTILLKDRRLALKQSGDAFVTSLHGWKAKEGIEDEFFYLLPAELSHLVKQYQESLRDIERRRPFTPNELSVIAGSFRRGRDIMARRGIPGVADRLHVAEETARLRIYFRLRWYHRLPLLLLLKFTSNFGTSAGRFALTVIVADITFAFLNLHALELWQ